MKIREALSTLDTKNDDHWTEDGLPRIDAIGLDGVTRSEVSAAAPAFTRSNPEFVEVSDVDEQVAGVASEFGDDDPAPPVKKNLGPSDDDLNAEKNARSKVEAARVVMNKANRAFDEARQAHDKISDKNSRQQDPNASGKSIRAYLDHQSNAARSKGKVAPLKGSRLDQSMARKTGHGGGRKQHPLKA